MQKGHVHFDGIFILYFNQFEFFGFNFQLILLNERIASLDLINEPLFILSNIFSVPCFISTNNKAS
jgi:hypothetical protein